MKKQLILWNSQFSARNMPLIYHTLDGYSHQKLLTFLVLQQMQMLTYNIAANLTFTYLHSGCVPHMAYIEMSEVCGLNHALVMVSRNSFILPE